MIAMDTAVQEGERLQFAGASLEPSELFESPSTLSVSFPFLGVPFFRAFNVLR